MPDRPKEASVPTLLNDVLGRLRAIERHRHPLQDIPAPEDIGDSVMPVPWDALVDAEFTVSRPATRQFMGIGEALSYLNSIGLTRANVFVRPGTYTETASITPPASVLLFGAPGANETLVTWNRGANFTMSATSWQLQNITVDLSGMTTLATPFGAAVTRFFAINSRFIFTSSVSGLELGDTSADLASFCYFYSCSFQDMRSLGANVVIDKGDYRPAVSVTPASNSLVINGLVVSSSSTVTWTIPNLCSLHFAGFTSVSRSSPSAGAVVTLTNTGSNGEIFITSEGSPYFAVNLTGNHERIGIFGAFSQVIVEGEGLKLINVTVNAAGSTGADITGPASIDIGAFSCSVILRGDFISGHIAGGEPPANRAMVEFIGADFCNIGAGGFGNALATRQSYNLDANSDKNILDFAGATTFPVAGVDAGTANLIRVT